MGVTLVRSRLGGGQKRTWEIPLEVLPRVPGQLVDLGLPAVALLVLRLVAGGEGGVGHVGWWLVGGLLAVCWWFVGGEIDGGG